MPDAGRTPRDARYYGRPTRPGAQEDWRERDFEELVSLACACLAEGLPPARIAGELSDRYGIKIKRELAWHLVSYAALHKRLDYCPPEAETLTSNIRALYPQFGKDAIDVIHTSSYVDAAHHGAKRITDILADVYSRKDECHIGFAAGYTMKTVAQRLARTIQNAEFNKPTNTLVIHTLVSGLSDDVAADPITFCVYFTGEPLLLMNVEFVMFHAPNFVEVDQYSSACRLPDVARAIQQKHALDLIITGAAVWDDPHNIMNRQLTRTVPEDQRHDAHEALFGETCVGDFLSHPIGNNGRALQSKKMRIMTVVELTDLPELISNGCHVVLVIGPCGKCGLAKTAVARSILSRCDEPLVTEVVLDSRTAKELHASPEKI